MTTLPSPSEEDSKNLNRAQKLGLKTWSAFHEKTEGKGGTFHQANPLPPAAIIK